ncbi:hypothetical protein VNO80_14308 [Phaseolus coccineus]|uniref:Uncharacterized protein n=1 Tax=Phaseolus coccineus TaxID=3886 RepID=A0AAN9MMW2_PHACN
MRSLVFKESFSQVQVKAQKSTDSAFTSRISRSIANRNIKAELKTLSAGSISKSHKCNYNNNIDPGQ